MEDSIPKYVLRSNELFGICFGTVNNDVRNPERRGSSLTFPGICRKMDKKGTWSYQMPGKGQENGFYENCQRVFDGPVCAAG